MAPGGVQQVREDEDYKNTSRQLASVLPVHTASVCGRYSLPAAVPQDVEVCLPMVHQGGVFLHTSCEITFLVE